MKSVDEIVGEPVEIPPHIQRLLGVPDLSLEDTMYFSIDENTTTVINPDDCQRLCKFNFIIIFYQPAVFLSFYLCLSCLPFNFGLYIEFYLH